MERIYTPAELELVADHLSETGCSNHDQSWPFITDLVRKLALVSMNKRSVGQTIPTISNNEIFSYSDELLPPADVRECLLSWKVSGLDVRCYNMDAAAQFIQEHLDRDVLEIFLYAHHPSMQSDIFRLARLYHQGGLYVDADDAFSGANGAELSAFNTTAVAMPLAVCLHCAMDFEVTPTLLRTSTLTKEDTVYYYLAHAPLFSTRRQGLVEIALRRAVSAVLARKRRQELSNIHVDVGPHQFFLRVCRVRRGVLIRGEAL